MPVQPLTLVVGELEVVVVQREVVLHGREAAGPGCQVSDTLVFAVQHLGEVIWSSNVNDNNDRRLARVHTCVCACECTGVSVRCVWRHFPPAA